MPKFAEIKLFDTTNSDTVIGKATLNLALNVNTKVSDFTLIFDPSTKTQAAGQPQMTMYASFQAKVDKQNKEQGAKKTPKNPTIEVTSDQRGNIRS